MTGLNAVQPLPSTFTRAWGVSLLVHGFAIAGAIWLTSEIRPVTPKETFRWEVAIVRPPAPEPIQEVKAAQPAPAPSKARSEPAPISPVVETPRRQITEVRPIESKPVVESRPVPQPVQTQTVTTVQRAIETPVTRATEPAVAEKPVAHREEVITQAGQSATERAVVSRQDAVVAETASVPVERENAQQIIGKSPVEHAAHAQTMPIQEAKMRPEVSRPSERTEPTPLQPSAPERPPVVTPATQTVPLHAIPGTRADYGWLKDLLARRIKEVKRYPHSARLNHWEGKVIVHAVIREDGNLADLRIHESSGHQVLDEDALETMRKACPLDLIHPLGRSQMAIRIPINYSLND